jgi:hypothetical protein
MGLPENHEEIYRTVLSAAPKGLSLTTGGPLTTLMELYTRAESREVILHCVNYDRTTPAQPFAVTVRKQFSALVKSVTCLSPDADDPAAVPFQESAGAVVFTVPTTRLYSMLVIARREPG